MFAWNINSWSVIHRPLFLFICSFYNQADVWRADHNHVYEKGEGEEKGSKSSLKTCMAHWCTLLY